MAHNYLFYIVDNSANLILVSGQVTDIALRNSEHMLSR